MKLCIPTQEKSEFEAFAGSPRRVKKWLQDLHTSNIQEITRNFFTTLKRLNRELMAPRQRLEYMELCRPVARSIVSHLQKRFLSLSLPLPEKSRKIFDLNLALLQEMAYGYKIVINDGTKEHTAINSKLIAISSLRATTYISEIMLRCAQIYAPVPEGLWYDLHQIYSYAELNNLHKLAIKDIELRRRDKFTISQAYKRTLMLVLAHPETLYRGEAERVYTELEEWTEKCQLMMSQESPPLGRLFGVNLDSDKPPVGLEYLRPTSGPKVRWLDVRKLLAQLGMHMNEDEDINSPILSGDGLPPNAQKRLWVNWGMSVERAHSRIPKNSSVEVEIGIKDIHKSILDEAQPAISKSKENSRDKSRPRSFGSENIHLQIIPEEGRRPQGTSGFINHPGYRGGQGSSNQWEAIASGDMFSNLYAQEQADRERKQQQQQKLKEQNSKEEQIWNLLNTSPAGFGLCWRGDGQSKAHVGEVLALKETSQKGGTQWRIGVVRWMRFIEKKSFEIGIQTLSPRIFAVNVEREGVQIGEDNSQVCLYLPEDGSLDLPTSLLTPSHMYKVGEYANVKIMNKDMRIQFSEILRHTGFFAQFRITPMPDSEEEATEINGKKKDEGYFDSVWDSI